MKKIVIVNGHPDLDSLTASGAKVLKKNAETQGCEVSYFNAVDFPFMDFNPAKKGFPKQFEEAVSAIEAADQLVFCSPMWNFTFTGSLKNFIDGVMQPDRLFSFKGGKPHGLLKTPKVLYVWTTGGPTWVYKLFMGNPMRRSFQPIFKFCGVKKYQEISAGNFMGKNDEAEKTEVAKFLQKLEQYKF